MNRRDTLRLLGGSALSTILPGQRAARPNVIFILTDDQRWDEMSCTGNRMLKTPGMDRLAREGVMFENSFVTTPLCSPARASFLTGQYVHKHGVLGNGDNNARSHQLVTFPRLLHDNGYETAYVGKWHMGNDDSPRPGFDRWVSFKGQGRYEDPVLNIDGKAGKVDGYVTDLLNGYAVEFIRKKHDKPFCLYLAHKAIHGPFTPAERHKNLYSTEPIVRRPNAKDTLEGKPALQREVNGQPAARPGGGSGDELIRNQMRCLMSIDEGVTHILETLEQAGQLDNTLVVYSSDNGYFWGEHGLGDKRWAYEESIRVPILMRYPRLIKAGTKLEQLVLNIDLPPTFLDLAGASIPAGMQGRSVLPLFRGAGRNWRRSFLAEYFAEQRFPRQPSWHGVRGERWKYVHYTEIEGMDELYDLKADPYEMKNLIHESAAQAALKQSKQELQRLLRETA